MLIDLIEPKHLFQVLEKDGEDPANKDLVNKDLVGRIFSILLIVCNLKRKDLASLHRLYAAKDDKHHDAAKLEEEAVGHKGWALQLSPHRCWTKVKQRHCRRTLQKRSGMERSLTLGQLTLHLLHFLDSKKLTCNLCVVYVVFSRSSNMPSNMATRHPGNQEPTHGSCPAHESSRSCRPARPFQPLNVPYSVAAAGSAHT